MLKNQSLLTKFNIKICLKSYSIFQYTFILKLLRSISLIQTFKKQYKITKYKSKSETCELKYSKFSLNNHNNTENDCSLMILMNFRIVDPLRIPKKMPVCLSGKVVDLKLKSFAVDGSISYC